jgi:hypothetical protein
MLETVKDVATIGAAAVGADAVFGLLCLEVDRSLARFPVSF